MPVSTDNAFSGPYVTNGATTVFPFTFTAPSVAEVSVLLRDADGVEIEVDPDEYAVTLGGDSGGSVIFLVAPQAGYNLFVAMAPSFTQDLAFEDGSAWLAGPVNDGYDRAAQRDQYLKGQTARALKVPLGQAGFVVRDVAAGQVLANIDGVLKGVTNSPAGAEDSAVRAQLAKAAAQAAQGAAEAAEAEAQDARDAAELAQAGAESARDDALAFGAADAFNTYADAAAAAGWTDGKRAIVIATDTGTHASATGDYGASGGQTPNAGYFTYSASLTKLVRKGALESALVKADADRAEAAAAVAVPLVDGFDDTPINETYIHGVTSVDGSSGPISPAQIWLNNPIPRTGKIKTVYAWAKSAGATEVHFHAQDDNGNRIFKRKVSFTIGAAGAGSWDVSGQNVIVERGWFASWKAGARVAVATAPASLYATSAPEDGTPITPAYISNYPAFSIEIERNTPASEGAVKDAIDTIPLMPPAGIHFLSPSNTRRTRAAIAAVRNGTVLPIEKRLILACPADSNTAGAMVGTNGAYTNSYNRNWFAKLAAQLSLLVRDDGLNIATDYNSFLGANNPQGAYTLYNPNFSSLGDWAVNGTTNFLSLGGGQFVSTTAGGNPMIVAIADGIGELELGFAINGALGLGVFRFSLDGGATWTPVDQSGAVDYVKLTSVLPAGTGRTIRFQHFSGAMAAVHRMIAYRTDGPSLVFANGAIPGSLASSTWRTFANPWSPLTLLRNQAAAAKFIMIGSNDIDNNPLVDLDFYLLWMRRLIYAALAKSDVFVITPPPLQDDGQAQHLTARQVTFYAGIYALCAELNVPFLNMAADFGTWAQANAAGLMGNYIHVNYYGDNRIFYMAFDAIERLG